MRIGLIATAGAVPLGAFVVGSEVRFNWLPEVAEHFSLGKDPDLEAVDWISVRVEMARRGMLRPGVVIAATRWLDAGKIDFALGGRVPVIVLGGDPREYGLAAPAAPHRGEDLVIVAPRATLASMNYFYGADFDRIEALPPVTILHAGRPAMLLPLFLGRRLRCGSSCSACG